MSKIYNALNVNSENELMELVESLNLDDNQYIEFMTVLNSELSEDGLKMVLENLTKSWYNGSYEKLQEQCSKKKSHGKRELKKIDKDTVYDHSWYEVKGGKYPKRTKEGVIIKEAKEEEVIEEPIDEKPVEKEEKPVSTADPELAKFIEQCEKVIDATTNSDILMGLVNSIDAKLKLAADVEQMNKLGELKTKAETKANASNSVVVAESYDPDDEEWFSEGDQVSFKWNKENEGDVKVTGTVREVQTIGGNRYYNISSYNNETGRVENYYRVCPVSNEMERCSEPEDTVDAEMNETCSGGCCSAGSVSGFAKRLGKAPKKKKRLPEAIDTKLFKESILNDMPCESILEGHHFEYFMNEGKWYLSCDNALVKTYDKDAMIESVDEIINNEDVTCGLLEGYSCYEMDLLMEDNTITPSDNKETFNAAVISMKNKNGPMTPDQENALKKNLNDPDTLLQNQKAAENKELDIGQDVGIQDSKTLEIKKKELKGVDKKSGLAYVEDKTNPGELEAVPATQIHDNDEGNIV